SPALPHVGCATLLPLPSRLCTSSVPNGSLLPDAALAPPAIPAPSTTTAPMASQELRRNPSHGRPPNHLLRADRGPPGLRLPSTASPLRCREGRAPCAEPSTNDALTSS